MSLWRQVTRGLRVLLNRSAADHDLADEVQHYLDEATDAMTAAGLPPEAACREARMHVGSPLVVREEVRASGWEHVLDTALADLRYGVRRLRSGPAFAGACIVTLALGIGASTAIFSAVKPILLDSLPYPGADRIVAISDFANQGSRLDVTFGTYRELVARSRSFDALAVIKAWQPTVIGTAQPERLEGQRVSAQYFRVLGVQPLVGRAFDEADDRLNGPNVVVLSDGLWRRRFAGDPAIVGQGVTLDDASFTVIGIMPPTFENVLAPAAELWAPLQYDVSLPIDGREWGHHLRMVGRLRPGVGRAQARQEIDGIAKSPVAGFVRPPWASLRNGFVTTSLQDDLTGDVKPALVAIMAAVLLVLVIACVNVTNLLLARGAQRRGEFAMRVALGAERGRLTRQLITETLVMALVAGGIGLFVAAWSVKGLVAVSPAALPRTGAIRVDLAAFAFVLLLATVVGLIVGVIPALHASRTDLQAAMQHASTRWRAGTHATRRVLVVVEVALAIVLLVNAGLLSHSLRSLLNVAPGFNPSDVLVMQVQTSGHRLRSADATERFFSAALDSVRRTPGVASAGFASQLPLTSGRDMYGVHFESSPTGRTEADSGAFRYAVTPGYVETMGIPLRRGRLFDEHDSDRAPDVALISESLARSRFPNADPIGQRIRIGADERPWSTIVGVVGDVRQTSLAVVDSDAAYVPTTQWRSFVDRALWLVVRTEGDPAALAPAIKRAIWSVDKDQPIVRTSAMEDLVSKSGAERRFVMLIFGVFALVALVLAATGIYGLLAGAVTERTREIGIRSALGASRGEILAMVLRQGLTLTGAGVAIGLAGAAAASRTLVTLLFGVSRLDPQTYAGVLVAILAVSAVACLVPAGRAARVDPAITLRAE